MNPFKSKYDQMQDNNPAQNNPDPNKDFPAGLFYAGEGHTRHVCFVGLDRRHVFLNYAYLVSGEFIPETNTITLAFTTHNVSMKGIRLEILYFQLMQQHNRLIVCKDDRYNYVEEETAPVVNHIEITRN